LAVMRWDTSPLLNPPPGLAPILSDLRMTIPPPPMVRKDGLWTLRLNNLVAHQGQVTMHLVLRGCPNCRPKANGLTCQ